MAEKRKLPARDRRESAAKRRASEATPQPSGRKKASTPLRLASTPKSSELALEPAPEPTPEPTPDPLPTKIEDGKPLPILAQKQATDLSVSEYQTVAESAILATSLRLSKARWLGGGMFEKYWSKPSKKKSQPKAEKTNPPKETMNKIGTCTVIIEPHHFDAALYAVKDPNAPQPLQYAPPQRPVVQYGAPNQFHQYQPHPPPQSVPRQPAPYRPSGNQNRGYDPRGAPGAHHPAPRPQPPPQHRNPPPPPPAPKREEPRPQPAKPSPDPVIQMLATRAASNPELKALMRVVAASNATQEQLRTFQAHIDELNAIIARRNQAKEQEQKREQQNHPPPPPPLNSQGNKPPPQNSPPKIKPEPAGGTAGVLRTVPATVPKPEAPTANQTPRPNGNPSPAPVSTPASVPSPATAASAAAAAPLAPAPAFTPPAAISPSPSVPNSTPASASKPQTPVPVPQSAQPAPKPNQTPNTPQAAPPPPMTPAPYPPQYQHPPNNPPLQPIRSRQPPPPPSNTYFHQPPPPPPRQPDLKAVLIEFTSLLGTHTGNSSTSGDRFIFPPYTILDYLPGGTTVIASFLLTRKLDPSAPWVTDPSMENGEAGKGAKSKSKKAEREKAKAAAAASTTAGDGTQAATPGPAAEDKKEEGGEGATGSKEKTPAAGPKLKEYYQPVTIRLQAPSAKILEPLSRAVKPAAEVRKHMEEIMDKMERAEAGFLPYRLPRDNGDADGDAERKDDAENETARNSRARSRSKGRALDAAMDNVIEKAAPIEEDDELKEAYDIPSSLVPVGV